MRNDAFSWRRLGRVARAELAGERRAWGLRLGGCLLFCLMIYMAWNTNVFFGRDDIHDGFGYIMPRLIVGVGWGIAVMFNISRSFRRYSSHGRAVEAFMVPATRSEKFVWTVLKNLVAVPLILLAIVGLNDLFWAEWLGFDSLFTLLAEGFRSLLKDTRAAWWGLMMILYGLHFLSTMAFFLAGAAVFRRHPFLWTVVVQFVLCNPLSFMLTLAPYLTWFALPRINGAVTLNLITLGLCVLWMCIAWWRFSKLQLRK
ncbi:hypothetical protein [uncultured Rikenella sp.]|uniref:hypothetical protein n=1 Tax=uncultured Rikenella sp. TaxID=368003 RepID=UPI0025DFC393|nr:hypothetical protein [uncultured Rikenella sp.]